MRITDYLLRTVGEAEMIPGGYGFVSYDTLRREAVFLPIPINLLVRLVLYLYQRIVYGFYPDRYERRIKDVMESARQSVWDSGYTKGLEEGLKYARVVEGLSKHLEGISQKIIKSRE